MNSRDDERCRAMGKSRLFRKTFGVHVALVLLTVGVFTTLVVRRTRDVVVDGIDARLDDLAIVLERDVAIGLRGEPSADWRNHVRRIADQHGIAVTVIAPDGTVVGDSGGDPAVVPGQAGMSEVRAALSAGRGRGVRRDASGEERLFVARRVEDDAGGTLGVLRVAMSMSDVSNEITAVQRPVWITAMAVTVVGLALAYLLLLHIVRPIGQLVTTAEAMADGDLDREVVVRTGDELELLAVSLTATSRDISARIEGLRRKSEELEANGDRLQTVLETMIEGVVAVGDDERILFANAAARRMLRPHTGDLVGKPIWEAVWNARVQEVVRGAIDGVADTETEAGRIDDTSLSPADVEFELNGRLLSCSARRLPGEPCQGLVLVLHDVTDLRRLENLRTDFVQNVSHELKTPLSLVQLNTETLLDWALAEDPEESRRLLESTVEQAERLHELIRDLIELARIDSTRDAYDVHPLWVGRSLQPMLERMATVAGARGVDLLEQPPVDDVRVRADEQGLRTIVENLVTNAVHYTPVGGRVTVTWYETDAEAVIEVEDTGVGIHPDDQARIFERFYRVDKDRSRDAGGTGLGLSIVKHLCQQFGGTVSVESVPQVGSTFVVRLPLAATAIPVE